MHVHGAKWIVGALLVLVLLGIGINIGTTLLPPMEVARTKGTLIPWLITWGMILATTAMGLVIVGYMIGIATGKVDVHS